MPRRKRQDAPKPPWEALDPRQFNRLKREALDDIWKFLELINFYGGPTSFGVVHKELAQFLTSTRERRLVLMPRGHLKSTFCSTLYVMWRIYKDPNIRIMVGTSNKGGLAEAFVREVKQYLENDDLRQHVWDNRPHIKGPLIPPIDRGGQARKKQTRNQYGQFEEDYDEGFTESSDRKVVWRSDKLQVVRDEIYKEPTLTAASVGSPLTGEHYDLVIFDDLVTFDNSSSTTKAEKILSWVRDIESVLNPYREETGRGEEVITLGTRYYRWDYYAHLMGLDIDDEQEYQQWLEEQSDDPLHLFERNIFANGKNRDDGYLWPEGFNDRMERRLRRRLGSRRFASQYLNSIMADEDCKFDWENVNFIHPASITLKDGVVEVRSGELDQKLHEVVPMLVVDPAASLSEKADFTAIGVGGAGPNGEVYLFDLKHGHWTPTELSKRLIELVEKWRLRSVTVEAVGYQKALVHTLNEKFTEAKLKCAIREYRPSGEKKSRLESMLQPLFESRQLYLMTWMANVQELKEEVTFFPSENVRDDIIDVIAVIRELSRPVRRGRDEKRKRLLAARTRTNSKYGGTRW